MEFLITLQLATSSVIFCIGISLLCYNIVEKKKGAKKKAANIASSIIATIMGIVIGVFTAFANDTDKYRNLIPILMPMSFMIGVLLFVPNNKDAE